MANMIEIENKKHVWYKKPNIPLIRISMSHYDLDNAQGLGHVREWINENLKNDIFISFYKGTGSISVEVTIIITKIEDYTAFKLMFPEYC